MVKSEHSFFNQIDIFGIHPLFTIRGKATFQTQIGSFLTIICACLILIYMSFFFDDMFNHKSPNLQSIIYYDEVPSEFKLTKNNFSFIFSLQTKEYINYIDESIYKVNAYLIESSLNKNGIYQFENIPIKVYKCNEFNFEIIPEYYKNLPLNNLYCLDNSNELNIKGDYMKEYWNYIKLNFSKCENSTYNNKCKSEEIINEYLNGGYIGIFIHDNSVEPTNYYKPYKTYIRNLYKSFSIKYYEEIFVYLKFINFVTDSGYFFNHKESINFTAYDYIDNNIDFRQSNNFLTLSLCPSPKREIYKRSYIKIQSIFSNVGGMLKIILLAGEYSVYFIRILLYKNYILEFFNLDETSIRLKQVRKIYNLKGNSEGKKNVEIFISNLSNIENNTSSNLIKNKLNDNYKGSKAKTIKFNIEHKKYEYNKDDDSPIINKASTAKVNFSNSNNHNDLLKNNFFLNDANTKITKSLLFRGGKNNNQTIDIVNSSDEKTEDKKNNIYNKVKGKKKTIIKYKNSMNNENMSFIKIPKKNKKKILIPKTKLRVIKIPGFCSDFVCKKNILYTIKQVHENYKEIQFVLDIVHYLKSQNELNIIGKYLFTEEQRIALSYTYTFKADFGLERKGYEYMIKHKKNKFDNSQSTENKKKEKKSHISKNKL